MITFKKIIMATTMVIVAATGTVAEAASKHMKMGGNTSQPIGHAYFCEQFPQECKVRSNNSSAPKLTKKRWNQIISANNRANTSVEPITDQDLYGVEEHWTYPKSYGDCEDYALLKRYMLLQQGWPESSLLITVALQSNGDGHAVLTVRTDRGDFILDNLETKVKKWNKTSYKYVKRQSVRHTGKWTDIKDTRSQVANY
ncbi:MAG: transglutaminase-like cysteine peptidase [Rhizobiaceae bacterium]